MVALRIKRQRVAVHFGFVLALYAAMPGQIAQQDLASLLAFHSPMPDRHGFFLSFSALKAATFSLPRPAAFAIPDLPEGLRVRADDSDITGSINSSVNSATAWSGSLSEYEEPQVTVINRAGKGDRLQGKVKVAAVAARTVSLADSDAANAIRQDAPPIETTTQADEDAEPRADRAGTLAELSDPVGPLNGAMVRVTGLFFNNDTAILPALPFQHREVVLASLGALPDQGSTTLAAKGKSPATKRSREAPPSVSASGARRSRRPKSALPTRSISRAAAK